MFSIRQGKWKLILGLGSGGFTEPISLEAVTGGPAGQLYDMEDDFAETRNLWLDRQDIVEAMTQMLLELKEEGRSRSNVEVARKYRL